MEQDPKSPYPQSGEEPRRRRYSAPKVADSTQFETLALTCGKLSGRGCQLAGGLSIS